MTLYSLALFLHILGAFGLMAALAIEATGLRGLRAARTAEQAQSWLVAMRMVRVVAPASIAVILVMGLYLMAAAWGWRGWIVSGLVALLLIGLIGGLLTGTRMARIGPAVGDCAGELPNELRRMLLDPILLISSRIRIALMLATLFLMSVKPSALWSSVVLLVGLALGVVVSQLEVRRVRDELQHQRG